MVAQLRSFRLAQGQAVGFFAFGLFVIHGVQLELYFGFARRYGQRFVDFRCRAEVGIAGLAVFQGDGDGDVFVRRFVQRDFVGRAFALGDVFVAADADFRFDRLRLVRVVFACGAFVFRGFAASAVFCNDVVLVFHRIRRQDHFARFRIDGDVFVRQGTFRLPFARRRVFDYGDGLRLVAFVGVFDFQFVRPVGRGDDHAAFVIRVLGHSRRRRGIAINDLGINAGFCSQLGSLRVAEREVVMLCPFELAVFGRFQGDFRLGLARLDGQGLGRIRCRGEVGVFCTFVRQGDGDGDVFVRRFVQLDGVGRRFAFVDFVAATDGNDRLVWLRRVRIGVVAISLAARRDAAVGADVVSRRHIRAVFDVFRRQGHFARRRINGDVFARQLAFRLPFARRRVFGHGDGLRLVAFVGVFDLQFVRLVGRGDYHAAFVIRVLGHSWRRWFATGHVVVNDRAFADDGISLFGCLAFEADGFVTFHCRVVNGRHLNFDAVRAARRYGDFEVAVGIWRDFRPSVATVGAHFDFFAKVSRHIATTVCQLEGDFGIGGRGFVQRDVVGKVGTFYRLVAGDARYFNFARRIAIIVRGFSGSRIAHVTCFIRIGRGHIQAVFDFIRRQGDFARRRINFDVIARQRALCFPFARLRIFDHGDGLRLVFLVGVVHRQGRCLVHRRHGHATLVVRICCHRRRLYLLRLWRGDVVVSDRNRRRLAFVFVHV